MTFTWTHSSPVDLQASQACAQLVAQAQQHLDADEGTAGWEFTMCFGTTPIVAHPNSLTIWGSIRLVVACTVTSMCCEYLVPPWGCSIIAWYYLVYFAENGRDGRMPVSSVCSVPMSFPGTDIGTVAADGCSQRSTDWELQSIFAAVESIANGHGLETCSFREQQTACVRAAVPPAPGCRRGCLQLFGAAVAVVAHFEKFAIPGDRRSLFQDA